MSQQSNNQPEGSHKFLLKIEPQDGNFELEFKLEGNPHAIAQGICALMQSDPRVAEIMAEVVVNRMVGNGMRIDGVKFHDEDKFKEDQV